MMLFPLLYIMMASVTAAEFQFPSSCRNQFCSENNTCREIWNFTSGHIEAQCLALTAGSSDENTCSQGAPLLMVNPSTTELVAVRCNLSSANALCPSGYECTVSFNNEYAVCCVGNEPFEKAGRCPSNQNLVGCTAQCQTDSDCYGTDKCCAYPCGMKTCQPAVTEYPSVPSCRDVVCGPGERCVLRPVQCVRAPCYPIPFCVPGPGSYPLPVTESSQQPVPTSSVQPVPTSSIEPVPQSTASPVPETTAEPVVESTTVSVPGPTTEPSPETTTESVLIPKRGACPVAVSVNGTCRRDCQSDAQCPGTKKCCRGGACGATCVEPAAEGINRCTTLFCPGDSRIISRPVPCLIPPCPTIGVCVKKGRSRLPPILSGQPF